MVNGPGFLFLTIVTLFLILAVIRWCGGRQPLPWMRTEGWLKMYNQRLEQDGFNIVTSIFDIHPERIHGGITGDNRIG